MGTPWPRTQPGLAGAAGALGHRLGAVAGAAGNRGRRQLLAVEIQGLLSTTGQNTSRHGIHSRHGRTWYLACGDRGVPAAAGPLSRESVGVQPRHTVPPKPVLVSHPCPPPLPTENAAQVSNGGYQPRLRQNAKLLIGSISAGKRSRLRGRVATIFRGKRCDVPHTAHTESPVVI
jgi:hypothetical protein